ncbi:MAG TPA: dephospho-CoA kinase [Rectinema sp.]|nr:dephospho-CoA kinase [Rectinema sp.]HRC83063.1 dephospho-CoA kinase [Rectinema sp.]
MFILGLTGGYCVGKNEVASILEKSGWKVTDVDKLGHVALPLVCNELIDAFGDSILREDGSIDRKKLGTLVFNNRERLTSLENIVHPAMLSLLDKEIEKAQQNSIQKLCINAALLYRFPQLDSCDAVIEVRAPLYLRIDRAIQRDHLSFDEALHRISSQKELWRKRSDVSVPIYMLWNLKSLEELEADALELLKKIENEIKGKRSFT